MICCCVLRMIVANANEQDIPHPRPALHEGKAQVRKASVLDRTNPALNQQPRSETGKEVRATNPQWCSTVLYTYFEVVVLSFAGMVNPPRKDPWDAAFRRGPLARSG